MKLPRRQFLHLAAGAAALPACRGSRGRKPIRRGRCASSCGFPAGTSSDITSRLIGQWLSQRLGQQFVVEDRPGAGTNIATEAVVHAAARRLHAALGHTDQRDQRHRSTTISISISFAISRRSPASCACPPW